MSFISSVKPYVYQIPVIAVVKAALAVRDAVLFVMAMGLGKTVVSAFVVEDRLRNGERGLFLCHETYILEQVEQEYRKVIGDDIVYKTFYGPDGESTKDWNADQADMLFASFQSMNNWHEKWYLAFDRDHFDFMVVDESHHGQAPSYREVIDYFQCKKIAMTATPDRMDLKDIREIFGEEVYTITLEEGIANGWLAKIKYYVLSDGINNAKLQKIFKDVLEDGKRVSVKQLNETIFIKERDKSQKQVIDEVATIKELSGDSKTLLFCERTLHADNLISQFGKKGAAMHSKKKSQHNRDVFTAFQNNKLQYVASVNKFNEGKHVPGVKVIAALRSTDSLTIFWQQLGRALAKTEGKEYIIYLDFVSNLERLVQVRDFMLRTRKIEEELRPESSEKLPLDENTMIVNGENFEFIFSKELVDIIKVMDALRKGYYETWEEASKAALEAGISSSTEYLGLKRYKVNLRLPPNPSAVYPDFPGWVIFLEKEIPPHEGWKTASQLRDQLYTSLISIKEFSDKYRAENPSWFVDYANVQGKMLEHYHSDLVSLILKQFSSKEFPTEEWLSLQKVAIHFEKTYSLIARLIKKRKLKVKHPDLFKSFMGKNHILVDHYHISLLEIIKERLDEEQQAPDGWESTRSLVRKDDLIVSFEKVKEFADSFRQTNPQWFKVFYQGSRGYVRYYHPDLVQEVYKKFGMSERPKAPNGWLSPNQLAQSGLKLRAKSKKIKTFAEQFRKKNPEWFKLFWNEADDFFENYHPDLVILVKKHFAKRGYPPIGWVTATSMKDLLVRKEKIVAYAESFREKHPHWFKYFLTQKGSRFSEHCHPDLVREIRSHFLKRERALEGWMTAQKLFVGLNSSRQTVINIAEKYRQENPLWFRLFCTVKGGRNVEHYHPDLVKKIKAHFAKK